MKRKLTYQQKVAAIVRAVTDKDGEVLMSFMREIAERLPPGDAPTRQLSYKHGQRHLLDEVKNVVDKHCKDEALHPYQDRAAIVAKMLDTDIDHMGHDMHEDKSEPMNHCFFTVRPGRYLCGRIKVYYDGSVKHDLHKEEGGARVWSVIPKDDPMFKHLKAYEDSPHREDSDNG